ncbi:MAG: metallophosphoesterase [Clostridiales bacterium]|nr:metallophosphoesterase [Clostridiales bacterium]
MRTFLLIAIPLGHLLIFWLITASILFFVNKKKKTPKWLSVAIAIPVTIIYMSVALFLGTHMYKTSYSVQTSKDVAPLRIALISDSHLGACFDGEGFADRIEEIEKQQVDMLVITGDLVDGKTKKEDMITSCEALGKIKTTYGVYYVTGNHNIGDIDKMDFGFDELVAELEKNGVHVLLDEVAEVGDDFYIVGRIDRSMDRKPISELTEPLDKSKYIIVLDHQPNDYDAEREAGCDLVLSGHTHGGQMIPVRQMTDILRAYDSTYGKKKEGDTTFIVTSGIGGLLVPYKTGTICEYCIIDIEKE